MALYRCVKCGNVDHLQITYPNGTHLLPDGKQVEPLCTICLGKPWHNRMRMEKYDPQWHVVINPLNGLRNHDYIIRIAKFQAPGNWLGYFNRLAGGKSEDQGSINNEDFNGRVIRDMNVPETDFNLLGNPKTFFQFGLFGSTPYDRVVSVDIDGLGSFQCTEVITIGRVDRHFCTDGHTNIYDWFERHLGKSVKITICERPAVKQNG